MTAIVGILNKHAIAVAADSAETIGNGIKIYNKANKIFTLSKSHPIGIAVCGGANLSSLVPWEIVIKQYRKQLGEKVFPLVKDYVDDFFSYIKNNNYFTEKKDVSTILNAWALDFWKHEIVGLALKKNSDVDFNENDFSLIQTLIKDRLTITQSSHTIASLSSVTKDVLSIEINSVLDFIKKSIEKTLPNKYAEIENDLIELYFRVLTTEGPYMPMRSSLAFFGYGEQEIYPTLMNAEVGIILIDSLSWYVSNYNYIDNNNTSSIVPMAQTDIMHTIIGGVDPQMQNAILNIANNTMQKFVDGLQNMISKYNPKMAIALSSVSLDPLRTELLNRIEQIKHMNYISPLLAVVSSLEKEDLAELAENLIYLTSLKRKITPTLETVGGPVDVAVVSKCDGFIWMKRKHYFDPNLNRCFFDNYYKK